MTTYDSCVIGGGFFGCSLAAFLAKSGKSVALLESEPDYLQKASYVNQARIHNGYHYPRHFMTAVRSRVNFPKFVEDYRECVVSDFEMYYAIGTRFSKTTSAQFFNVMSRVGAPVRRAEASVVSLFNRDLIEDVFSVQEYVFDSVKLKAVAVGRMDDAGVIRYLGAKVDRVALRTRGLNVAWTENGVQRSLEAQKVYNCTYSDLNTVLRNSNQDPLPLKHELAEMCLIRVPEVLADKGITVMCGPFFSVMPFPSRGIHSLSHVRYTPHFHWQDHVKAGAAPSPYAALSPSRASHFPAMIRDARRYLPILGQSTQADSLWGIKTTLPSSEKNDGRPILFHRSTQLPGLISILGGKIDNIYDVFAEIERGGE